MLLRSPSHDPGLLAADAAKLLPHTANPPATLLAEHCPRAWQRSKDTGCRTSHKGN